MAEEHRPPLQIVQPKPRRYYDLAPSSTNSSEPPSPPSHQNNDFSRPELPRQETESFAAKADRSRSILNLTSSTLTGIYKPASSGVEANKTEPTTPFGIQTPGIGLQTPNTGILDDDKPPIIGPYVSTSQTKRVHRQSNEETSILGKLLQFSGRSILLFLFGVGYGLIVMSLHDRQEVVPVEVQLKGFKRDTWEYFISWGAIGVLFGSTLPWVDALWEQVLGNSIHIFASDGRSQRPDSPAKTSRNQQVMQATSIGGGLGAEWNPVVRGVGAFIGIAFAIRRLPWESNSQLSLILALVNPVLWYLVDRSKPGFLLSTFVGLAGTGIAFGVNPGIVPPPPTSSPLAGSASNLPHKSELQDVLFRTEIIGIGTWIASVLFCSSVCFGNLGRKLAMGI